MVKYRVKIINNRNKTACDNNGFKFCLDGSFIVDKSDKEWLEKNGIELYIYDTYGDSDINKTADEPPFEAESPGSMDEL